MNRLNALVEWLERRPIQTLIVIGLCFLTAYTLSLFLLRKPDGRIVMGDAVHYYVYLRSATFDRDLHFRNDYITLYGLRGGEPGTEWVYQPTETGHVRNMMSIGPPLLWTPLYLLVVALVFIAGALGIRYPLDGFGSVFQASAGFSGIVAATLGACVTFRLAERYVGRRAAIWSTLLIWLGANAIYYSVISPTYSHSSSMLVVSLFFYVWATTLGDRSIRRFAGVGALAGLCALVRWQDAVFLIVPAMEIVVDVWTRSRKGHLSQQSAALALFSGGFRFLICTTAALLVFSPQVWVWMTLYGRPVAMPQGSGWMQWTTPHFREVLFSDWHGLFTWTPLLALAVAGFFWLARDHRHIAVPLIAAFILSLYVNAAVVEWWGGEAYGARRFVSCFPIFVLALGSIIRRFSRAWIVGLSVAAITYNGLLLLQYQLFMHGWRDLAPYPGGFYNLVLDKFVVPFRLIARLWDRLVA